MNYNFCLPPNKDEGESWGVGGSNFGIDEIYLWDYEKIRWVTDRMSPIGLWSRVLEEEHIHNLLRKLDVVIDVHHWFIDKILRPIALGCDYSEFNKKGEDDGTTN